MSTERPLFRGPERLGELTSIDRPVRAARPEAYLG